MQWVNIVAQGILLGGLYALYGTGCRSSLA
jgi:hypothetical protein